MWPFTLRTRNHKMRFPVFQIDVHGDHPMIEQEMKILPNTARNRYKLAYSLWRLQRWAAEGSVYDQIEVHAWLKRSLATDFVITHQARIALLLADQVEAGVRNFDGEIETLRLCKKYPTLNFRYADPRIVQRGTRFYHE